jgi:hypothetical protein
VYNRPGLVEIDSRDFRALANSMRHIILARSGSRVLSAEPASKAITSCDPVVPVTDGFDGRFLRVKGNQL